MPHRKTPFVKDCFYHIFNSYSKAVNQWLNRTGLLMRYIHRNPLEAGLVRQPEEWPYSNYSNCIGLRKSGLFDRNILHNYFGSIQEYQMFVNGLEIKKPDGFEAVRLD